MKKLILILAIATLATTTAFAQSVELIGRYAWMTTDANEDIEGVADRNDIRFEVDDETGYGAAINIYWSDHISTEIGASWIEPSTIVTETGDIRAVLQNEQTTIIPITAVLQYHFSPDGAWDFYIGAGGAWVIFDDFASDVAELEDDDIDRIDFDDDAGLAANVGVNVMLADNFAFNIDAKYVPLKSATTVVFGSGDATDATEISFNPLIVSAGVSWRF